MQTIRLIRRFVCLAVACFPGMGCAEPTSDPAATAAPPAPAAASDQGPSQCAAASSRLGADLLTLVPQDENGVFSPASISTAFGMLYAGARGETAAQIKAAMHFTSPPEQILAVLGGMTPLPPPAPKATKMLLGVRAEANNGYGLRITEVLPKSPAAEAGLALNDLLFKIDDHPIVKESDYAKAIDHADNSVKVQWFCLQRGVVETKDLSLVGGVEPSKSAPFHAANAVWVQRGHPFNPQYKTSLGKAGGSIQDVDFKADAEGSAKTINAWVSQQTHGRIPSLLESGALNDRTRLVLTNAVYLHAEWTNPFQGGLSISWEGANKPDPKVSAMSQLGNFAYAEANHCQVVEIPYKDSSLALTVFLPKKDVAWNQFRKDFSADFVNEALTHLKSTRVKVTLPKFRIAKSLALESLLREKMPVPFSDKADFGGISDEGELKVSAVRHQAFINVDEKGTEAGAATAVSTGIRTVVVPDATFLADHPFLFVLRDCKSKVVLFLGQLVTVEPPAE